MLLCCLQSKKIHYTMIKQDTRLHELSFFYPSSLVRRRFPLKTMIRGKNDCNYNNFFEKASIHPQALSINYVDKCFTILPEISYIFR